MIWRLAPKEGGSLSFSFTHARARARTHTGTRTHARRRPVPRALAVSGAPGRCPWLPCALGVASGLPVRSLGSGCKLRPARAAQTARRKGGVRAARLRVFGHRWPRLSQNRLSEKELFPPEPGLRRVYAVCEWRTRIAHPDLEASDRASALIH